MSISDFEKRIKKANNDALKLYTEKKIRNEATKSTNFIFDISHKFLEKTFPSSNLNKNILELGASKDEHLKHCRGFRSYVLSDMNLNLLEDQKLSENVEIEKIDASKINSKNYKKRFDRVIACNLLEHLENPEEKIVNWMSLLEKGGYLSLLVPCDPGILWRFGRNFGPRRDAKKQKLSYDLYMALEHKNPVSNLITIIEEGFKIKGNFFPFPIRSWNLNLFYVVHIKL